MNEMINGAGDGSGLQLPPAFVMVNPKQHRKYKKNNEKVDGRSKGARDLFSRIQRRKMKEHLESSKADWSAEETESPEGATEEAWRSKRKNAT